MIRYLLTLAFVLLAASGFPQTAETWVIQEDGGGDYTTVAAAESAQQQNLTSTNKILTFEIQETWTSAETGGVLVGGWTMDATRFLTITATGAARATATWSTTAYRTVHAVNPILTNEDYVVFDGLQANLTHTSTSTFKCISITGVNGTVKNCFVKGASGTNINGIDFSDNASTVNIIRNCVIIDFPLNGIDMTSVNGGAKLDNNSIENCGVGIVTSDQDVIARNNIIWNVTTPLSGNFNTTTLSEENYTDAASLSYGSCGSCGTGDQLSQSDPFINLAGEDYGLTGSATALNTGKDLSGDFTDSINGVTRPQGPGYDKGAFELTVAAEAERQNIMIRKAMMFWVW